MNDVEKRKNGKYTCLDCMHTLSEKCFKCKGWGFFDLDPETVSMTYQEKCDRHDRIKQGKSSFGNSSRDDN